MVVSPVFSQILGLSEFAWETGGTAVIKLLIKAIDLLLTQARLPSLP
jgi:hypothetical protein